MSSRLLVESPNLSQAKNNRGVNVNESVGTRFPLHSQTGVVEDVPISPESRFLIPPCRFEYP